MLSGVASTVLQDSDGESREMFEIRGSRLKSSIPDVVLVDGPGTGDGLGVCEGDAVLIEIPLFQTNFLPDFMHV